MDRTIAKEPDAEYWDRVVRENPSLTDHQRVLVRELIRLSHEMQQSVRHMRRASRRGLFSRLR
jgi:hypothetical protein